MTTDSRTLYATLLGLKAPWEIEDVAMDPAAGEVVIRVALAAGTRWACPECLAEAPICDHQEWRWRHLDICQFRTIVAARVPRQNCPTHGIKQLTVPWAGPGARLTALFEALAIDWPRQASIKAGAQQLRLSWDGADGILQRAGIAEVAMDMWGPCIQSTQVHLPAAHEKIPFDKFHVAQHLGNAVDLVRRQEHQARRSRLEPMRKVAEMLQRHGTNLRTYFTHRITNAGTGAINAKIQAVKRRACGFRSRQRFRVTICFHCGGLDSYPASVRASS